jgi:hypothetical protein
MIKTVIKGSLGRWQSGEVAVWGGGSLAKLQSGEVAVWGGGSLARWQSGEVAVWGGGSLGRWQPGEVAVWGGGSLWRWQSGEVAVWRGGSNLVLYFGAVLLQFTSGYKLHWPRLYLNLFSFFTKIFRFISQNVSLLPPFKILL